MNKYGKIVLFAGTYEGRRLCELLGSALDITVCVATEYGETALCDILGVRILRGRLGEIAMQNLMLAEKFDLAVDATHPYAVEVTANIKSACAVVGCEYLRLLRGTAGGDGDVVTVADVQGAVEYLSNTSANALITTGSKELATFCTLENYRRRLFVRVLPSADVITQCKALGFLDSHIIAMQGPFSHALNSALLRQFDCAFLVGKDSGVVGGAVEKLSAAHEVGAVSIIIGRHLEQEGLGFSAVLARLRERFCIENYSVKRDFFPLFVRAGGKRVLVVGGGKIAKRRVETLLKFAFEVSIIAPRLTKSLEEAAQNGTISHRKDVFHDADINGFNIVIAATNDRAVNARVGHLADENGAFVSVADCAEECNFYFPAVIIKEDITVGIVGNGKNHDAVKKAAAKLRQDWEDLK